MIVNIETHARLILIVCTSCEIGRDNSLHEDEECNMISSIKKNPVRIIEREIGGRWPSGYSVGLATGWLRVQIQLRQFIRFGTLAIPFTQFCQCLSEETLKAVSPFYLVAMPREVKDPTSLHWKCVTCRGLHHPLETTRHHGPHWK